MKKYRPTTSSRRGMSVVKYRDFLSRSEPFKPLLRKLKKTGGRNNRGRITVRHRGGGAKRSYRVIDFKQNKIDIPAKIESIEYDPNRTAFIALVVYKDGERRYIIAPHEASVGNAILTSESAPLENGNRILLKNVPVGYFVYNVETRPGQGGILVRSAGSTAQVLAQEGKYTHLKMPSGEVRMVLQNCWATLGQVSNVESSLVNIGKAGRKRRMGRRPVVRGSAMNAVDHPYGGGEGKAKRGTKRPKTKWGKVTGGRKTRKKKKWSNSLIIKRRKSKREK